MTSRWGKALVAASLVMAAGLSLGCSGPAAQQPPPPIVPASPSGPGRLPGEQEINALFDRWNAALATGDANRVAEEYLPNGTLLPTVSSTVRQGRPAIADYFARDFLPGRPRGTVLNAVTVVMDSNSATRSGTYDFVLTGPDGAQRNVPARFTFVYELIDGIWYIVSQHSSSVPPEG